MKVTYENRGDLNFVTAALLSYSDYNKDKVDFDVSATQVIRPGKQIVLGGRVEEMVIDPLDNAAACLGSALHSRLEEAMTDNLAIRRALKLLDAEEAIDLIVINPDPEDVTEEQIPIYIEKRSTATVLDTVIAGQFDVVVDGCVHDLKTTSVYSYIFGSKDDDYIKQLSIYRYLNQDIITSDHGYIHHYFKDWLESAMKKDKKYPRTSVMTSKYRLLSLEETEELLEDKIKFINEYGTADEKDIPPCTSEELWATETKYKYFRKPGATRATRVFDNAEEADALLSKNGGGEIRIFPGEIKACKYCNAVDICNQAQSYISQGRLNLKNV